MQISFSPSCIQSHNVSLHLPSTLRLKPVFALHAPFACASVLTLTSSRTGTIWLSMTDCHWTSCSLGVVCEAALLQTAELNIWQLCCSVHGDPMLSCKGDGFLCAALARIQSQSRRWLLSLSPRLLCLQFQAGMTKLDSLSHTLQRRLHVLALTQLHRMAYAHTWMCAFCAYPSGT